jgi:exopolysaccharide biosynthesis polyprenyl glycosylphosphotransferase
MVLLLGDVLLIILSQIIVISMHHYMQPAGFELDTWRALTIGMLLLMLVILSFYLVGLYDISSLRQPEHLILSLVLALGSVILIYSAWAYFIVNLRPGKIMLLRFVAVTFTFITCWRLLCRKRLKLIPQHVLLIGNDPIIKELKQILTDHYSAYYSIEGHWHTKNSTNIGGLLEHNDNNCISEINNIDLIIYSVNSKILKDVAGELIGLRFKQINICDAHDFYQYLTWKTPIYHFDDFWMLINSARVTFFPRLSLKVKRVIDLMFAICTLPIALPLLLISAIAIKLDTKGPIFFIQERLGQNEIPFGLIKLRTMIDNAEKVTGPKWSAEDDPRITRVGKILRKLRLDELPQFFNILNGDMSIIGPRPIRKHFADFVAKDTPYYRLRFLVKPGLTGWAQVNHNYAGSKLGQSEKLQYELFYLIHQSFWLDLFIIIKTVRIIISGKGI